MNFKTQQNKLEKKDTKRTQAVGISKHSFTGSSELSYR